MPGKWISITIEAEIGEAQAAATSLLLSAGCRGVVIDDAAASGGLVRLTAYVPDDDSGRATVSAIQASLTLVPELGIDGVDALAQVGAVDEEDWANGWKKYFRPIRIGRRLVVTPPWESPDLAEGEIAIVIDPGMAFGTGSHPTTQLCLVALEELVVPGAAVADIGTGSGILSIAAAKLGAGVVYAVDIDPLAVRIASENAQVNGAAIETSNRFPIGKRYDVVVANIIADTLIEMATELSSITAPGGFLIASGIIEGRAERVAVALAEAGLRIDAPRLDGEWVALIGRKPGGAS